MTEQTDNLVLEQLRLMRIQNDRILDELRGLKIEMTAIRHHVRGVELVQDKTQDDMASLQVRVERIERRLALVE